jgi:hypothetical protein
VGGERRSRRHTGCLESDLRESWKRIRGDSDEVDLVLVTGIRRVVGEEDFEGRLFVSRTPALKARAKRGPPPVCGSVLIIDGAGGFRGAGLRVKAEAPPAGAPAAFPDGAELHNDMY